MNQDQFAGFGLSEEILETLRLLKYEAPTPIQKEVIPLVLAGKDVIAKSQTGTGKTAAFAIPICEKVIWEENRPQALVLEPTRELAVQVREELFHVGRKKRLKVPAVFGGFPIDKQIQTLKQKSHIVVGTPGRVMDHIRRDSLKTDKIRCLVIDEADLMLDMGFLDDVKQIMDSIPGRIQILLFSATIGERVKQLSDAYLSEAAVIEMESETETAHGIEQAVYNTGSEEKYQTLFRVLVREKPSDCMIFCGTREMVNVLYRKLSKDGLRCGMIHGEVDQADRLKTIEAFRDGRIHYLIATDVAARGVDFDNISHVVNYDFPTNKETFVHRCGRTGRNGKTGRAISLVTEEEERMKQAVEAYIGETLPVVECPVPDEQEIRSFKNSQRNQTPLKVRKGAALNKSIMRLSIGGGKKSKIRAVDIVGTICNVEGIGSEDIGIIDVRDSLTYVEILNGKGEMVLEALQSKPIKGKLRKVRKTRTY
ncbi:DEAD/DEAH box helicase [Clostridium sp. chh4-2]|uniref:DEAD/DEAH box helicase n=1 Tax=Clostridium sp. chh4-2 TaxID=2067550 RepID=UPI000CCE1CE5|nr:DEAD/DEAH box helicase [Clostridium sp. chh4-2]PNV63587.1 DEAD/DEAH box helicase [Clostridium sp. chh4-2]